MHDAFGRTRIFAAATTIAASLALTTPAWADNRIVNGDFSAGFDGFTTSYTYGGSNSANGNLYINSGGDHTTGSGTYLNVDSNSQADYFWSETLSVVANTDYTFTAFVRSINGGDAPIFAARIGGSDLFTPVDVTSRDWTQVTASVNSGSATSLELRLYNDRHSYSYNDLGVDDLSFVGPAPAGTMAAVPEPATWALMLVGFGAVGYGMRRRVRVSEVRFDARIKRLASGEAIA